MTPEEKSRKTIDRQLEQCGWIVQNRKEMNISAGLGMSVREFPSATGEADYLLYSIAGEVVSIAIFDNRLEIASTGTLPFGLTEEDLKREHTSRPRNPLLAEVFYRRGLIERWGRGTQRLVELCVEARHPEPEFE
jgi:hypothetical protein